MIAIDLDSAWRWWLQAALACTILLAAGSVALAAVRTPARRVRLAVLTLVGCLLAPVLPLVPGAPRWSVPARAGLVGRPPGPTAARVAGRPAAGVTSPPGGATPTPGVPAAGPSAPLADAGAGRLDPRPPILAAWLLVAAGHAAWWAVGQVLLARVLRSARPVPPAVRDQFAAIAGPRGASTRLLAADRLRSPITFTLVRPAILLPTDLALGGDAESLRFALAHEWSHAERHDYAAWTLGSLVGVFLAAHPLYWYVRRQLRLGQDFLADDRAAGTATPAAFAAYLVRLARARARSGRRGVPLPALGIGGRRSHLTARVAMLIEDRPPHATRCRPLWSGAVAALAAAILVAAAGIRLDAAPGRDEQQPNPVARNETGEFVNISTIFVIPNGSSTDTDELPPFGPGSREWTGRVVDRVTGRPVAGARVRVNVTVAYLRDEEMPFKPRNVRSTTTEDGSFRFRLTPVEQAEPSLWIAILVDHPDHVQFHQGYHYSQILKKVGDGQRSVLDNVELLPAAPIEGLVLEPDGTPAVGVKIEAFSIRDVTGGESPQGEYLATRTDAQGRFRMPLHARARVQLWLLSEQFEPMSLPLAGDRRGDLGTIRLGRGVTIRGRVIDAAGQPAAGVYVSAEQDPPVRSPAEVMQAIGPNRAVRSTVTLADGTFALAPLPPGPVGVEVASSNSDPLAYDATYRPLPGAYVRQPINLEAGQEPPAMTIRPVPQVTITVQYGDSKGAKRRGEPVQVSGMLGDRTWMGRAESSAEGRYTLFAPKGLPNALLNLTRFESNSAVKHRITRDGPLIAESVVALGTLDRDMPDVEFIRYAAPTLWVKATTRDGRPIPGAKISLAQMGPNSRRRFLQFTQGLPAADGRYRVDVLPPDSEVEIKVAAQGFAPQSRRITLPEGKTEEMAFVLEPQ